MVKWKRREHGGYVSECGRFRVQETYSKFHRQDGFKWVAWDDARKDSVICRTARAAKEQARIWSLKQVLGWSPGK